MKVFVEFNCEDCNVVVSVNKYAIKRRKTRCCRPCSTRRTHAYLINQNYFDDINLQSYYWAGYFFADATLYPETNRIAFELSSKDIDVLQRLKEDLDFEGPVSTRRRRTNFGDKIYSQSNINFTSEKIYNSLKNYGVTENKTVEFNPPDILNINHEKFNIEYAKCFFIGLIDGDGSINMHSEAQQSLEITQYGNYSLCLWVKELIKFILGTNKVNSNISKNRETLFKFTMAGKNCCELFNILYDVHVDKLNRKWNNPKLVIAGVN